MAAEVDDLADWCDAITVADLYCKSLRNCKVPATSKLSTRYMHIDITLIFVKFAGR